MGSDYCVCCGYEVPEGRFVCAGCELANGPAPCKGCAERSIDCHVYCEKYKAYAGARAKARDLRNAHNEQEGYFIKKAKSKKYFGLHKKSQYKEI